MNCEKCGRQNQPLFEDTNSGLMMCQFCIEVDQNYESKGA